jgi:anti-sigma regulatory factor (Ser/Thr protein kinase)
MTHAQALRHHAFVYESDAEYVERSVGFLKEGLDAGEWGIVANTRDALAKVREAMGPDAERVSFVDVSSTYDRPASAVAAYHGLLLEHLRKAPSVRAVADFQVGPVREEWTEWVAYEAITNIAYSHLPAWVLCTYDANALPDAILDGAAKTHPEMLGDGWHPSDEFEDPRDLLRTLMPDPEPIPGLRSFSPTDDLETFREQLARRLVAAKVSDAAALRMLVAGTEVAANAIHHGAGIRVVRTGRVEGRFVCEVVDSGAGFDDPVAGYVAPRGGRATGLWVARQLAWRVECFRAPEGFTVRLWL